MTESTKSGWKAWHYYALWGIAVTSLVVNIALLAGLYAFRLRAQTEVENVARILNEVELSDLDVPIVVDEVLPIVMTVPFSDTFSIPIDTTIPVSTTIVVQDTIQVPINETVRVNRDVTVSVVILGQPIPIDIPIRADIPIALDITVPVDLEVPVETDIPVNLQVDVPVQTEVPIETEVPVQLDFPVTIPLDQLGFSMLLQDVKDALNILAEVLGADTAVSD